MTNLTPTEAALAGGIIGSMLVFIITCGIIFWILMIIANWKIFKKAGEPGWKSIIPIYNVYIMFKIVNMKNWFWWLIAINICASIMFAVDGFSPYTMTDAQFANFNYGAHPTTIIALLIIAIAEIWAAITYAWRTAKVFGHGCVYTIGLLFLPNIFWLILGFGSSKYNKKNLKK